MRCSKHPKTEVIGICMHCGRAVCLDCVATTRSERLTCSQECAEIIDAVYRRQRVGRAAFTWLCIITGFVFLAGTIMMPSINEDFPRDGSWIAVVIVGSVSALMFAIGIWMLRSRQYDRAA